jgi:beta-galactosidase
MDRVDARAETQGEAYLTYLNGISNQKSLGSSALDGNRFPKLTYQIYKNALWVPFSIRPGVALQSHWNLSGVQEVDAWSNCPSVELFLNGISLGVRQPDEKRRCTWKDVTWQSGELKAVGRDAGGKPVCADLRQTAGAPHHILLVAEPRLTRPSGEMFQLTANGSDAAILTATIVDANGNWCPLADNNIRFKVAGLGNYRGSYNFYVTPNKPITYHAPGDPELQAEGGLMRVALRSTFQPGTVQVTAESDGLGTGMTSFQTVPRI